MSPPCDCAIPRLVFGGTASGASTAWPAANAGLFFPVEIIERCVAYGAFTASGITAGGNFDLGIFDTTGNKLASTGATARVASSWQSVAMADYTWEPGDYYIGMACDTTGTIIATAPAAGLCEAMGVAKDDTAYSSGLSATVTYVRTTYAYVPVFGFETQSVPI